MQAYYGLAKIACLCSYCCYRHLWFYDSERLWRVEIATLRVGATVKEGKGQGEGRKKCGIFSRISPPPPPLTLTRPIFSSFGVSTRCFREQKHSLARRKRLHCRLAQNPCLFSSSFKYLLSFSCPVRFLGQLDNWLVKSFLFISDDGAFQAASACTRHASNDVVSLSAWSISIIHGKM